jgi:precorrin-2/cobalt-factor-2 C20-methyltransferase
MNARDEPVIRSAQPVLAGTLHGVGVGPGDPELMTLRAARLISEACTIAYFAKKGRTGHARTIAARWINADCEELPLHYPMTTETHFGDTSYLTALRAFYETAAIDLGARLAQGHDVVVLCEGDPLFYGSFMHLHERMRGAFRVAITSGVTGMAGCWGAAGVPMTWGDDALIVLPGTLDEEALVTRLRTAEAAVIMKLGSNFPKVRRALERTGLASRAIYVERGTMAAEAVVPLCDKHDDSAPYFSLILVPGAGRRP